MTEDAELLRRFAADSFQPAFSELVQRHIGFVYAAALRQVHGDTTLAQDVTQQVFIDLARKASVVARHRVLAGWLFTSTRYAAHNAMRGHWRRRAREQEAHAMQDLADAEAAMDWQQLAPVFDEALSVLDERDRDAVLLRFFEGRAFPEIGARLNVTADAARQRVERALEKMRVVLAHHGIRSTAAALAMALTNQPAVAVPAGLATTIVGVATLGGAGAAFAFLGMTKLQLGLVTALVAAAGAGVVYWQSQASESGRETVVAGSTVPASGGRDASIAARKKGPGAIASSAGATGAMPAPATSASVASQEAVTAKPATLGNGATAAEADQRRAAQSRRLVLRRYGALFDELALSGEQREKMIHLLINVREASTDFAAAKATGGEDMSQDQELFQKSVYAMRQGLQEQIKAVLGEDGYQRFLAADEDVHRTALIEQMQKKLQPQGAPLTAAQSEQLLGAMRELHVAHVTDGVVERATEFLSPEQTSALQAIQDHRQQGVLKDPMQKAIHENLPAGAK